MAQKRRGRGEGGLEELPSGSWRVEISLGVDEETGRRVRERHTCDTKREALDWRARRLAELGRAGGASPGNAARMTVGQWLTRWLHQAAPEQAPATAHRYEVAAKDIRAGAISEAPLRTASRADVKAWMEAMREAGRPAGEIGYALGVLRAALTEAVREGMIPANPTDKLKRPKANRKRKQHPLDRTGCLAVIAEASRRSTWWHAWFRLGIDSGCRPSEMLALRVPDVDLARGVVHVQRNLCRRTRQEKAPKTESGNRRIPIGPETVRALAAHLDALAGHPWHTPEALVFPNRSGAHREYAHFANSYHRVARAAGFPKLAPYDLRHTCATLLLSAGVSLRVVADRLGHSSPAISLKHYAHALPGQQEAATQALASILAPDSPTPAPRPGRKSRPEKK